MRIDQGCITTCYHTQHQFHPLGSSTHHCTALGILIAGLIVACPSRHSDGIDFWSKASPAKFECDFHFQTAHAAAAVEEAPKLLLILAGKEDWPLVPDQHAQVVRVQQNCGGMHTVLSRFIALSISLVARPVFGSHVTGRLAGYERLTYYRRPQDSAKFKKVWGLLAPLAPARVAKGPKDQQEGIREAQPQAQEDEVASKARQKEEDVGKGCIPAP